MQICVKSEFWRRIYRTLLTKYDILNTKQRAQIVSKVTLGKPERKFEV